MDNTELHYLTYDPEEIWKQMTLNYVEAGGDILYPGDEKEMLLRSVQADIVQAFAGVDNALRMQTLRYAVGNYLDIIGENRGCERLAGDYASAEVKITTKATGLSATFKAGMAMTSDGSVYYRLAEDLVTDGSVQELTGTIVCEQLGIIGNGLPSGTKLTLASPNASISNIVTTSEATGGENKETDEAYRIRIRNHGLASVTTGPARQYKESAMAVSSEIIDASVISPSAGDVNVYILLRDMEAQGDILHEVETKLSADDTRPLTDHVTVAFATKIDYLLKVEYETDNSVNTTAIENAVRTYIEWQNHTIGLPFNPDRLMALMYQAGASRVTWKSGSTYNGSSNIKYTEIDANKYSSGTVELTKA